MMVKLFDFNIGITNIQTKILKAVISSDSSTLSDCMKEVKAEFQNLSDGSLNLPLLDQETRKILPLLYSKLGLPNDSFWHFAKAEYRRNTVHGRAVLKNAIEVSKIFEQYHIEHVFLKGLPIILSTHQNFGIRPMQDLDVFVPSNNFDMAIKVLEEVLQLNPRAYDLVLFEQNSTHAVTFLRPNGIRIDLHCYYHQFAYHPKLQHYLLNTKYPCEVNTQKLVIPDTTLLLYRCLIHGIEENAIRWVHDSVALMKTQINWDLLFELASKENLLCPVLCRLSYLNETFAKDLQGYIPTDFKKLKVPFGQRVYFYYLSNRRKEEETSSVVFKVVKHFAFFLEYYYFKRFSESKGFWMYFLKRKKLAKVFDKLH
jgi:hypothetical protein